MDPTAWVRCSSVPRVSPWRQYMATLPGALNAQCRASKPLSPGRQPARRADAGVAKDVFMFTREFPALDNLVAW